GGFFAFFGSFDAMKKGHLLVSATPRNQR
ncbi:MAG: hypothetical protein QOK07_689, partial [Gemmatimonadaceae bacterium]|nr:hypothetical protein [Gemmatimonadaceae bacterium]